jgi:hypothetical protein
MEGSGFGLSRCYPGILRKPQKTSVRSAGIPEEIRTKNLPNDTPTFPVRSNGRNVSLTTHIHLVLRLRICGAIRHPPYVFMAWFLIEQRASFTLFKISVCGNLSIYYDAMMYAV